MLIVLSCHVVDIYDNKGGYLNKTAGLNPRIVAGGIGEGFVDRLYMIIKRYDNNYLQDVLHLHKIAMENVGAYKGDGPWDDDLRDITKYYLDNNGEFLIVLEDDKLIGMGAYRKISAHEAEIKRMRVAPEYQGMGMGKMILEKLEISAIAKGYSTLILETSDKQAAANALYKKSGFIGIRREMIDGYNCTWYEKKLTIDYQNAGVEI